MHQYRPSDLFTWEHINAKWKFFICRERKPLTLASSVSPVTNNEMEEVSDLRHGIIQMMKN